MNILSIFDKTNYQPLNAIYISKDNLVRNYQYIKSLNPSLELFPVLKSNAYGHGILEIGSIVDRFNCKYICVDSIFEAYQLLKAKVKTPILIMGYVHPDNLSIKKLPFSYAVWSEDQVEGILRHQPKANLHLFVDTGMHREGVRYDELESFANNVDKYKDSFEGIMSHYASADDLDSGQNKFQSAEFLRSIEILEKYGFKFEYKHISATAGILNNLNDQINTARLGIGLYGIDPSGQRENLRPVLKLSSTIVQVKKLRRGESVGYNATFTAEKDMVLGILPMGYNDGIDRRLSGKGVVKVKDRYIDFVGRISMNLSAIDLTDLENVSVGEEVLIFSDNPDDLNSIEKASELCGTIPYDLLVKLNPQIKRLVY